VGTNVFIDEHINAGRFCDAWFVISPRNYFEWFVAKKQKSLFIYATYDTTFPLEFSAQVIEHMREATWTIRQWFFQSSESASARCRKKD
jgi:hypothetical protein